MTLRQYCDSDFITATTGITGTFSDSLIAVAESEIDTLAQDLMDLMNRNNLPSVIGDDEYNSSDLAFGTSILTLPAGNYALNHYQYTVVELLANSGSLKKGKRIAVVSSIDNVLTLDSTSGVTNATSCPVKIYQVGVFPRSIDDGKYAKSIPIEVQEAVAWQVAHLSQLSSNVATAVKANSKKARIKSESIGSTYSYSYGDKVSNSDSVCVKSQNLLNSLF
jgi:hypothetical protein